MNAVAVTTCMVNARTGATAAMAVYIATRGTGAVVAMNAVAGTTCMVNATTFATTAKAKDRGATIIRTIAVVATNASTVNALVSVTPAMAMWLANRRNIAGVATNASTVAGTTCMVNATTGATTAKAKDRGATITRTNAVAATNAVPLGARRTGATAAMAVSNAG